MSDDAGRHLALQVLCRTVRLLSSAQIEEHGEAGVMMFLEGNSSEVWGFVATILPYHDKAAMVRTSSVLS
jgi:hypothetical protein